MKTLSIATMCGCLFLALSGAAQADAEGDILSLIGVLDAGLCGEKDGDPIYPGCDPEFDGWFGESTDIFRKSGKERKDRGCIPEPEFPAEDSSCNYTNSKAEWRHDTLRASLESSYRKLVEGKDDTANRIVCTFVDKVNVMDDEGKIVPAGADALVDAAELIAKNYLTDCLELDSY